MEIAKIIVTDLIMAGNLLTEEGYDLEQSTDNLAELKGRIIMSYLEAHYPEVEVCVDIAIQKKAGEQRPLEVLAYTGGGEIIPAASDTIRQTLIEQIAAGVADAPWAIKKG